MLKKLFAMVAVTAITLTMVSCGADEVSESDTKVTTQQTTEIKPLDLSGYTVKQFNAEKYFANTRKGNQKRGLNEAGKKRIMEMNNL